MVTSAESIIIRPFGPDDSISELTALIHKAYKQPADIGFRFLGSHQDTKTTARRIAKGQCFVAVKNHQIIGTIIYHSPSQAAGHEWYDQNFVASFGQYAVDPAHQNTGTGTLLLNFAEQLARTDGATEIALDTPAQHQKLVSYYERRGYRKVGTAQWKEVNYRSSILSKQLSSDK